MPNFKEIGNGTIGPNSWKREGSSQPDFNGSITLNGEKTNIAVWRRVRKDEAGKSHTFYSFALTQRDSEEESETAERRAFAPDPFVEDDGNPF